MSSSEQHDAPDKPAVPPATSPAVSDATGTVTQSNDPSFTHADGSEAPDSHEVAEQRLCDKMDEVITLDEQIKLFETWAKVGAAKNELRKVKEKLGKVKEKYKDSVVRLREAQDNHYERMATREGLSESKKKNIEVLRRATAAVTSNALVEEEFGRPGAGASSSSMAPEWFTDKEKAMLKARREKREALVKAKMDEWLLIQEQELRVQEREQRRQRREEERREERQEDRDSRSGSGMM
ncbi:MAG: hypothetical protein Q9169_007146 [Polycauliona sp. 2 TL-2023]